jgi:hypothetical protein
MLGRLCCGSGHVLSASAAGCHLVVPVLPDKAGQGLHDVVPLFASIDEGVPSGSEVLPIGGVSR